MADVVASAQLIETEEQARAYYRAKLAGAHKIQCYGRDVTIVFEADATHLFSEDGPGTVTRRLGGGRNETRAFNVERARMMDLVLPAISKYSVSIPGQGPRGREKKLLHSQVLPDGRYLRVVLRPGPGTSHTCVSAYPVERSKWLEAFRCVRAKFPP